MSPECLSRSRENFSSLRARNHSRPKRRKDKPKMARKRMAELAMSREKVTSFFLRTGDNVPCAGGRIRPCWLPENVRFEDEFLVVFAVLGVAGMSEPHIDLEILHASPYLLHFVDDRLLDAGDRAHLAVLRLREDHRELPLADPGHHIVSAEGGANDLGQPLDQPLLPVDGGKFLRGDAGGDLADHENEPAPAALRAAPENSFHFSSSAVSRTRIEGSPLKISVTPFLSIRKRSC